ncbi:hypothetical protein JHK87_028326 [Glycine soja]|nr:hypothetical protein JHK87_028326 [Glycine soja]
MLCYYCYDGRRHECCMVNILSFTSPRDVRRLSLVSSIFRSDAVWDKFLPSDFHTMMEWQMGPPFPSTIFSVKDLYLYLYQKPLLIDDGKMMGEFFNDGEEDKQVEMGVYEIKSGDWKDSL